MNCSALHSKQEVLNEIVWKKRNIKMEGYSMSHKSKWL